MTSQYHQTLLKAPLYLSHQAQIAKAMEELSELLLVLSRYNYEPAQYLSAAPIVDEIADVMIMSHQLACIFGFKATEERIAFKVERLRQRIDDSSG